MSLLSSGLGGAGGVPGGAGIGTGYGGKLLHFQIFSQYTTTLTLMRQLHDVLWFLLCSKLGQKYTS